MAQVKEHYEGKFMAADSSLKVGTSIAGFLVTTTGTITVTDDDGEVIINAHPVTTAQGFIRIPLFSKTSTGMTVSLGGGASGTLFK